MKTTITDVAKRAGVSMKTVSRVLNNEPNVAQVTRDKVKMAARELNYSPNLAARGLASSRSFFIALLYDNPSPGYLTLLQRGAVDACRESGYHLVLQPMDAALTDPTEIGFLLSRLGVDGIILAPPLCDHEPLRQAIERMQIPVSLISSQKSDTAFTVNMDEKQAAETMTDYLIGLGHRRIGFIIGHKDHSVSHLRYEGFQAALRRHDITPDPALVHQGDFTLKSGVRIGELMLSAPNRPTAIFASNDDMAVGVVRAALQGGLSIPKDVSICGFDNAMIAEMIWPSLTTIAQPVRKMGWRAAKALIDNEAANARPEQLDFRLVERDSAAAISAAPPV